MFNHHASLDPLNWESIQHQSQRGLADMLSYLANIEQRPVWQRPPQQSRFQELLPLDPMQLDDVYAVFTEQILPYAVGNAHPGFMGWAHGGGTVVGLFAEMLAAGLNSNLGGRDHVPIAVEQQVVAWMRELFHFPNDASGLFVTGSSLANLIALLVARTATLGSQVRARGMCQQPQLIAYASAGTHGCVARGLDMAGIGSDNLHKIGVDHNFRIDVEQLHQAVSADRQRGLQPFCVVGNAGTVDVGAVDDLSALAEFCKREQLWFHVDGACGALGMMSPELATKFSGIEHADSLALDFHKWAQVPYDAGFILVRDPQLHHDTFAAPAAYLSRSNRGLAAGSPWPCDFGPDLSRSFKALKVWFTLKTYGVKRMGEMMSATCQLAQQLALRVQDSPELELLAPVQLNIVCFRYRCEDADRINSEIVAAVQESGIAAPSATLVNGQVAIRAALFNHRTQTKHIDALIASVLQIGRRVAQRSPL